jgi:ABC-type uncharacterized transport system ATPase subunit
MCGIMPTEPAIEVDRLVRDGNTTARSTAFRLRSNAARSPGSLGGNGAGKTTTHPRMILACR